jgi:hypothetical protein
MRERSRCFRNLSKATLFRLNPGIKTPENKRFIERRPVHVRSSVPSPATNLWKPRSCEVSDLNVER